ncbi:LysR family transcriptional regulator [Kineococcus sp. GCM10028916]|uniref:LysR family transcriptional regulator n=1 Tax=Kineococcus sp. GCM10028916 TaxID=3273394 RepID=UPI00363017F2
MELRALECFVAVSDEGSFSRAAERLGIAQPSVSQQVRKLEAELDLVLFERGSRGVVLSAAGADLLASARRVLTAKGDLQAAASERAGQLTGTLDVGVVDGLEVTALPQALGVLRSRHPLLELRLQDGMSRDLLDRLASRHLDAVVIAQPPRALPEQLGSRLLLEEEVVVVGAGAATAEDAGDPERVQLKAVAPQLTVSYPPGSGVRSLIDAAAREVGATLRFPYTSNDPALHTALVRAGLGGALTVGSTHTRATAADLGVRGLEPPIVLRKVLVWVREPRPPRTVEELVAAVDSVD